MAFCSKCGANVPDGLAFCSKCGQALATAQAPPPQYQTPGAPSAAQVQGKQALEMVQKGFGATVARMGMLALIGTVVAWIAWFFLPGFAVSVSMLGTAQGTSSTLWSSLTLDPSNNMAPGSFGFLSIVAFICVVLLPIAAAFIPHPLAKYLYGGPLFAWLIAWGSVEYEFSHMMGVIKQQLGADVGGLLSMSMQYGGYIALLAGLAVAARIFIAPAAQSAVGVSAAPAARPTAPQPAYAPPPAAYAPPPPPPPAPAPAVYSPAPAASAFCTSCGNPLAAGMQFCTACGARASA